MRSPSPGAHAKLDRCFSSFVFRNACLGGVRCSFLAVAGIGDPGGVNAGYHDCRSRRPQLQRGNDKGFTDTRIHRAPDCAITCREGICLTVALSPPVTLSDTDKLDALCRLDQFRQWRSLDEKRFCLVCGKIITGRQIQVAGGTRGNGPLRLSCPTERCNSIPMDWVLPTDEILAKVEVMAAEECKTAAPMPANHRNGRSERAHSGHHGIASQLRKFSFHFKRSA